MGKFFLLQFFLTINLLCPAQPASNKLKVKVDSLVNSEMQKQKIPGLSIVVVKDGKVDYIKGYGFANLEHKVAVKPESIFQAGSVGKQFTAFAIMLLVEDGKMSLEDRLTKFFPNAPIAWDAVTVKNLLTHTGGFGDYPANFNFRADYTEDSLLQVITRMPLSFKVGEKSQYSNIGYVTLGLIIGKVTGKFYGEFLKQRIFKPLGMSTARIISEYDIIPNRAAGYRMDSGEIKNQQWVSPTINTTADGSLYLTALDMAKWEGALNAGKLLKPESYKVMWSPVKLNNGSVYPYAFGWRVDSVNGKRILDHNGTWQGFESVIRRYPDGKLGIIVFTNLLRSNPNKIATRVMELYQPQLAIPKLKPIKDNEPQVTLLVSRFILNLINDKVTADMLTPEFGNDFLTYSGRTSAYLRNQGTFKRLELLDRKELENGERYFHYRLIFSAEVLELLVTLTKDNKISKMEGRE
ncbi:MAG: serine hydrolase domain-containing protein [Ferruginibacter sp.]